MRALLTVDGAATRLEGPLLFLRHTVDVGLNEAVDIEGPDGRVRLGRIAALDEESMTIEVLESTAGLALAGTWVRFQGPPLMFQVGPGILGRVFNGIGEVIDGGPPIPARQHLRIEGLPIKPVAREAPRDFIESGVTAIDLMNSLVRGQKLSLFSGAACRMTVWSWTLPAMRACAAARGRTSQSSLPASACPTTAQSIYVWKCRKAGPWSGPRYFSTWPVIPAPSACGRLDAP